MWNPAPAPESLDPSVLSTVDLLVVNETESKQLGGSDDELVAARNLAGLCPIVVMTRGKDGCLVFEKSQEVAVPTIRLLPTQTR